MLTKTSNFPIPLKQSFKITDKWMPEASNRARKALEIIMQKQLASKTNKNLWSSSTLGRTGFPFEFAFTTNKNNTLRYTAEFYTPNSTPSDRLDLINPTLKELGSPTISKEWLDCIREFQEQGDLKYGAWIGGRHSTLSDNYKLYFDIPNTGSSKSEKWANKLLGIPIGFKDRINLLDMIGLDLKDNRTELYYRIEDMHPMELLPIMQRVGLEKEYPVLLNYFQQLYGKPIRHTLPGSTFGYSYSIPLSGNDPVIFTFYTFANTLFGGDMHIRKKILKEALYRNWNLGYYKELTAPLQNLNSFVCHHGMAGFVIAKGMDPFFSFGITPSTEKL